MTQKGVLVATDENTEWLLPWWWERYSACNSLPVAFVDLGMSSQKRAWCEERGVVFSLEKEVSERPLSEEVYLEWKQFYGESYLVSRKAWFKKPLACLLTPFEETVWIDLDCEVLDSLDSIFSVLEEGKEIAVMFVSSNFLPRGLEEAIEAGTVCNSGVIVFRKKSLIVQKWADLSFLESDEHWGDDSLLSVIISRHPETVSVLSDIYNWRISRGLSLYAKIIHWCGEWGKFYIAKHGGLKSELEKVRGLRMYLE